MVGTTIILIITTVITDIITAQENQSGHIQRRQKTIIENHNQTFELNRNIPDQLMLIQEQHNLKDILRPNIETEEVHRNIHPQDIMGKRQHIGGTLMICPNQHQRLKDKDRNQTIG